MAGFASGFSAGSAAVERGFGIRDRRIAAERQKVLDGRNDDEYAYKLSERGKVDSSINSLTALNQGVYDGSKADFSGTAPEAEFGPVPQQQQMAPVTGMRMPGADPSAPAPAVPSRRATGLETNRAQQNVALAQRDMNAYSQLNDRGRVLEEDEAIANATIKPEDVLFLNKNHRSLSLAPMKDAKGNLTGYQTMRVAEDGQAVARNISLAEAKKVAGALAIMQMNPTRALAMMSEVDKGLAAQIAAENGLTEKMVTTGNAATSNANKDAQATAKLEQDGRYQQGSLAIRSAGLTRTNRMQDKFDGGVDASEKAAGLRQGYLEAKAQGNKAAMAVYGPLYEAAATRALGFGIKLPGLSNKREVDPKDYAATMKSFVEAGFKLPEAQMRTDALYGNEPDDVAAKLGAELAKQNAAKGKGGAESTKPAPRPMTGFETRREGLMQAEATRRAQEDRVARASIEAERQRLLQTRPDLQQLGGNRYFQ